MQQPIQVNYKSTTNVYTANKYLQEISKYDLFAADFEVAIRYTKQELVAFTKELSQSLPKRRKIELESKLAATALDHPSHTVLTHCSIAISDNEAYVFILDNKKITDRILNFLINTPIKQIWHNASFDFRQIQYRTGKFPILYEDTQIYAKTILNHVETWKANTGLKELAGHKYGAWGISADNFTKEQMYEEHVLKYAATDSCATYWLYNSINNYVKENS